MNPAPASDTVVSDLPFMDAFPPPSLAQWRVAVDKVLKGGDFEKRLVGHTADGIRVEPLYTAASPSERPQRAASGRWHVAARVDHPDAAEARAQALADLEGGADSLVLSFAGARAARGYGLVAQDAAALDATLGGTMLDLIRLRLDPGPHGCVNALTVAELFKRRGITPAAGAVDFGLDPLGHLATQGRLAASWTETGRELAQTIRALTGRGFSGPFVTIDTRSYHEAGASEAQELGIALATAIAYLRSLEAEGFSLAEACDALSFVLVADTDEFLTVAKLRAARLLWDRVQSACGLAPTPMALHAETAWRSLTKRDPWVNMLRGTIATFSAGIAGADSLTVLPFTAALGLPDSFARRVARNTQLVLLEEANLWRVSDPAAGAGSFETLTRTLCEQGWAQMQAIERQANDGLPGIVSALTSGHLQAEIARQYETRMRAIATRREPITGTSEFANLKEAAVAVLDVAPISQAPLDSKGQLKADVLPSHRLAEAFEALRDKADAFAERPAIFLATLGPLADFTARAGFARNLFEAGGLAAPVGDGFAKDGVTDIAALVKSYQASGARIACLCGSDTAYAAEAIAAAQALVAAGASVWLAGRPGAEEAALNQAGISAFIYAGCDVFGALSRAHATITERRNEP